MHPDYHQCDSDYVCDPPSHRAATKRTANDPYTSVWTKHRNLQRKQEACLTYIWLTQLRRRTNSYHVDQIGLEAEAVTSPAMSKANQCIQDDAPVTLVVAGQVISRLSQLSAIVEHRAQIAAALSSTITLGDLIVLLILGWFTLPVVRLFHRLYFTGGKQDPLSEDESKSEDSFDEEDHDPFESSYAYFIACLISQLARLSSLVYLIDCLIIIIDVSNPDVSLKDYHLSLKCAKIIYSTWAASRLMAFKRYLLSLAVKKRRGKLGKIGVYDRIVDLVILFSLAVAIMGFLSVDIGPGLASLFAFGGVGTLVISLACKDLAVQLVCGVVVSTSENFYVGDDIRLGTDNTCGVIERIGWLYTDVRGYNEIITRIPNEQIANRRICNISRIQKCQVKQELRFQHTDFEKITPFCDAVKEEIKKECPQLICDGTRPFRATLRDIKEDHLLVVVDAHFHMPPIGSAYFNNRHKVLETICRVLKEHNITLACTTYRLVRDGPMEATEKSS